MIYFNHNPIFSFIDADKIVKNINSNKPTSIISAILNCGILLLLSFSSNLLILFLSNLSAYLLFDVIINAYKIPII